MAAAVLSGAAAIMLQQNPFLNSEWRDRAGLNGCVAGNRASVGRARWRGCIWTSFTKAPNPVNQRRKTHCAISAVLLQLGEDTAIIRLIGKFLHQTIIPTRQPRYGPGSGIVIGGGDRANVRYGGVSFGGMREHLQSSVLSGVD
jgi:hypothetical protein